MKNTFGSNDCQLLCINSSEDVSAEGEANPWVSFVSVFVAVCFLHHRAHCFVSSNDFVMGYLIFCLLAYKHGMLKSHIGTLGQFSDIPYLKTFCQCSQFG